MLAGELAKPNGPIRGVPLFIQVEQFGLQVGRSLDSKGGFPHPSLEVCDGDEHVAKGTSVFFS